VREAFDASHTSKICGYGLHGHTFTAEVTIEGEPDRDGSITDYLGLSARLHSVIGEFAGRDLGDMLVPAVPEQLCLYLRERLALFYPAIVGVKVSTGSITASVEFPLR
jgi:6-pyruvoyl-tetrahydropterin synthase